MRKILLAASAVLAVAAAAPAAAECTDAQLQAAAESFFDSAGPTIPAATVSGSLTTIASACPDDPYTQKIVALGFANLASRPDTANEPLLAHASNAFAAMERMHRSMPKDSRTRGVYNRSNQLVQIGFNDNYDLTSRVVRTLLVAEARAGRLAPANTLPAQGDAPITCDVFQTSLTQEVSFWIRNNQDSPGGMNILNKRIANCQGNEYNRASIHAHRARAILGMLKRSPARADAADLLRQAFADVDVLKATRENVRYDWGDSDQNELVRASWAAVTNNASGFVVPADRWFDSKIINQTLTNMSIAAALDAAYAKDIADAGGANSTFPGYRAIISDTFKRLQALPPDQQKTARTSLYTAAKMHADGTWRSDANKALKKPYDFLYNWIDPNYKPPATPAAPAATP